MLLTLDKYYKTVIWGGGGVSILQQNRLTSVHVFKCLHTEIWKSIINDVFILVYALENIFVLL